MIACQPLLTLHSTDCLPCRQMEYNEVKGQCLRVQELCRGSVNALRECVISLEERLADSRREVQLLPIVLYVRGPSSCTVSFLSLHFNPLAANDPFNGHLHPPQVQALSRAH